MSKLTWKTVVVPSLLIFIFLLLSFPTSLLANWYANLGSLEMARVELEEWPSGEASDEQVVSSLGKAETLFHKALKFDPHNRTAHYRLGLIDFRRKDFSSAVDHLEQAYQLNKNHRGIWRSLGSSYVWSGELDQFSALDEGVSLYELDSQNHVFVTWLAEERDPHDWLWLVYESIKAENERFAIYLMEQQSIGDGALVLRITNAARKASEDFSGSIQAWVGAGDTKSLWNAAEQATADSKLDDALLAYHALRVITGENAVTELALFLWEKEDNSGSAEAVFQQALKVYPNSGSSHRWLRHLGDLMWAQNRWEEAQTAYQRALKMDPDNLPAHIGLGWAYYEHGDGLEAAIAEFQQAIGLYPDRSAGYSAIGRVLEKENRFLEATPWFEQALEADPECRWCYVRLADNVLRADDLPLALEIYKEALSRFPAFDYGYYQISWAYYLDDQPQNAIASIEKAMALDNTPEPWMLVRAARIYEWVGEFGKAISFYRSALEINPSNEEAKEGLSRLEANRE